MHKIFKFCANVTNYQNVIKFNTVPSSLNNALPRCCTTIHQSEGKLPSQTFEGTLSQTSLNHTTISAL